MGNLVWHEYSRIITLTASVYIVWAGFFGLFFRKFFWDFFGGTLRNPGGLQPSPKDAVFTLIIVKLPIIQSISMAFGILMIALEYPLPLLKATRIQRSIVLRIPLLLIQAALAALFYQGTNGAIWSILAAVGYSRAVALGEVMKDNNADTGRKEAV